MGKPTSRTLPEEFLKERTLVLHPTEPAIERGRNRFFIDAPQQSTLRRALARLVQ